MKLKLIVVALAATIGASPAVAAGVGEGCDTVPGREDGQQLCDSGLICTGPYEGVYGHGNCQVSVGACDRVAGRAEGQQLCPVGYVCTGPFEGVYEHGNCQPE